MNNLVPSDWAGMAGTSRVVTAAAAAVERSRRRGKWRGAAPSTAADGESDDGVEEEVGEDTAVDNAAWNDRWDAMGKSKDRRRRRRRGGRAIRFRDGRRAPAPTAGNRCTNSDRVVAVAEVCGNLAAHWPLGRCRRGSQRDRGSAVLRHRRTGRRWRAAEGRRTWRMLLVDWRGTRKVPTLSQRWKKGKEVGRGKSLSAALKNFKDLKGGTGESGAQRKLSPSPYLPVSFTFLRRVLFLDSVFNPPH